MAYSFSYLPTRNGVQVTVTTATTEVVAEWTREEAQRHVHTICKNANLPAPWGGK